MRYAVTIQFNAPSDQRAEALRDMIDREITQQNLAYIARDHAVTVGPLHSIDSAPIEAPNYMLEFRSAGSNTWHRSPHPARPQEDAEAYAKAANAQDRSVVYRAVPWDGL